MELKLGNNKHKIKLSISKKEKNLLFILGITVLLWVSYQYLFTPQQADIEKLTQEKIAKESELAQVNIILASEAKINNELEGLSKEFLTVSKRYFPKANQPELMHMLNDIIDNGQLNVPNITFANPQKIEELDSDLMETTIPFIGTYKDLNNFFSQIRDNPKRLLVSALSLVKDKDDMLSGQISIDAYTYEKQGNINEGYFYTNPFVSTSKYSPFKPFEGYVEPTNIPDINSSSVMPDMQGKGYLIDDMEEDNVYFLGTSADVTGKVGKINIPKFGKSAIRAEYFISTGYKAERAFVVLDDKNITLKYPPDSIGIWAYAYGYSPATIGFRFKDPNGRNIDMEIKKGVDWNDWEYIYATPPQDLNVYPLKLDRIYFELGANRDDYSVMLFDRIECSYSLDENSNSGNTSSTFYIVKSGDTLTSISENFYGTELGYTRIMKENGLEPGSKLIPGEILVISK